MSLLMRIRAALAAANDAALVALGQQLDAVLVHHADHAASVAAAASRRPKGQPKGAPALLYLVELAPGWRQVVAGAQAAREAVAGALTELGSKRTLPQARSFAAMLSTTGTWHTLVDTDNGTVAISVTRQPAQTTGTDIAPRKSHAKNPKSA